MSALNRPDFHPATQPAEPPSASAPATGRFRPQGELTIYTAAEHRACLVDLLAQHRAIEVDLSAVSELDTAGLQLLILAKHEADRRGARLRMVGHSAAVTEVFDALDLVGYFGDPIVLPGDCRP